MDAKIVLDFLTFIDCQNLTIRGEGLVDGLGYDWWDREWAQKNKFGRPHLLQFERVQTAEITGVRWINSPFYHLNLEDIDSVHIHDLEIFVDILKQRPHKSKIHSDSFEDQLINFGRDLVLRALGDYASIFKTLLGARSELSWPVFPLNTDGIDPYGSNVLIENVNITNFDDAIAVKPSHSNWTVARDGCSQDIEAKNVNVFFGIGAALGSVTPDETHPCIRRVKFSNFSFQYPLKSIYMKSNPGNVGSGEITNVTYENMTMHNPLYWNIYIGPQ